MPWTFSHPVAAIPVHRLFRGRLNFAALVIGTLSPDFAYYVRKFSAASFAHTVAGTLLVCLPVGLLALALFYALRRSLCFMLPQPHRAALMPLASVQPRFTLSNLGIAAASVLLGAWTHTIWDSATHQAGWVVEKIPLLGEPLISIGSLQVAPYYILQQSSTLLAAGAMVFLYARWLRRQPSPPSSEANALSDRSRWLLLGATALIAFLGALPFALQMASHYEGFFAFRVFAFRFCVYSTAGFFVGFILFSVIIKRLFDNVQRTR